MNQTHTSTESIPDENPVLQVTELFTSIQGESTWAGLPCTFIRLTGCNLRCHWCDTVYAYDGGTSMNLDEILRQAQAWHVPLVEITGGEPLLQPACAALASALLRRGHTVLVETNGSLPINRLPDGVIRIVDMKCPGSGMHHAMRMENLEHLNTADEVKFVLTDRTDYLWAIETVQQHHLAERCRAVLFSPVRGRLPAAQLAAWILEDRAPARLQLQLHTYIWEPGTRGV